MPRTRRDLDEKRYVFFWKTSEYFGFMSQWSGHGFKVVINEEELCFRSCEQWMMYQKALLFRDKFPQHNQKIMDDIMKKNISQKRIKSLGRKVKGFDEKIWKKNCYSIVYKGNKHKFQQNEDIRKKLLKTDTKILIEASPFDRIWGIGYKGSEAIYHTHNWGLNLLGEALMHVREKLKS